MLFRRLSVQVQCSPLCGHSVKQSPLLWDRQSLVLCHILVLICPLTRQTTVLSLCASAFLTSCVFSHLPFPLLAVTWQGRESQFTLHYDAGFTLCESQPAEDGRKSQVFWHYPFEKLRMSADDGMRLLWLDFGEDGEQVRKLREIKELLKVHQFCD